MQDGARHTVPVPDSCHAAASVPTWWCVPAREPPAGGAAAPGMAVRIHAVGRGPGAVLACPSARAPGPRPARATRAPAISSNKQLISINHNFAQLS